MGAAFFVSFVRMSIGEGVLRRDDRAARDLHPFW